MNLAGYIRVSTEGQVDAYGKDVQRAAILKWAELNGHLITHFYEEDAVSGKTDGGARPALSMAIEQAERKRFEGIVVFDASRLARRLYVQETLLALVWQSGLRVFTTTAGELAEDDDDPTRILIRQVLGIVAEFEHRTIVKRLHNARREKSSRGGYVGGTPRYGMSVVGRGKNAQFVHDEVECRVIEEIRLRHANGESLRTIAASLNRRGIQTKTGKAWEATQVQRIIKRYENT